MRRAGHRSPRGRTTLSPNGGSGVIRGATRRRHADSQLLKVQTPTTAGAEGTVRPTRPAEIARPGRAAVQRATEGRQQGTRVVPRRDKTRPTRTVPGYFRHKTRLARTAPDHFRYKTRPAHPFSPHARYKTRPARPKWPFLAHFSHAWRTLYRCRQQQATHGELFRAQGTTTWRH